MPAALQAFLFLVMLLLGGFLLSVGAQCSPRLFCEGHCIRFETDMSHGSGGATLEHIVAFVLVSMQLLLLYVLEISLCVTF